MTFTSREIKLAVVTGWEAGGWSVLGRGFQTAVSQTAAAGWDSDGLKIDPSPCQPDSPLPMNHSVSLAGSFTGMDVTAQLFKQKISLDFYHFDPLKSCFWITEEIL